MDQLEFSGRPDGGARISCCRWLRPPEPSSFPRELRFGVATRSRREDPDNGDAFVIKTWPDHALAGVIDGLGHGELASHAAQAAKLFVESHCDLPLGDVFAGVERTCHGTRGVVMALAHFDLRGGVFRLASVGNIEARLLGGDGERSFIVRRGILGLSAPRPVVTEHAWTTTCILILHSDGIRSAWRQEDLTGSAWASPADAAQGLVRAWSREDDDATVVVVRSVDDGR
jgi:serine/threonine protein phosphatase PrpC